MIVAIENPVTSPPATRLCHFVAALTVWSTVVLLALGAIVTTFKVGMSDPIWPTEPWYIFMISWREPSAGFLIEHTHRFAGWFVGLLSLILCTVLWLKEPRRWVVILGTIVVAAVTVQGLLGGFRVRLNEIMGAWLALIHGNFAQIVLALMACVLVVTSKWWHTATPSSATADARKLHSVAHWVVMLVYVQIFLGGLVRHKPALAGQRLHLLCAFVVVAAVVWLWITSHAKASCDPSARFTIKCLAILTGLQVMLGVEAYIMRMTSGTLPELQRVTMGQAIVRTLHYVVGAGMFALAVAAILKCRRLAGPVLGRSPAADVEASS